MTSGGVLVLAKSQHDLRCQNLFSALAHQGIARGQIRPQEVGKLVQYFLDDCFKAIIRHEAAMG